jgi:hypothetical protein
MNPNQHNYLLINVKGRGDKMEREIKIVMKFEDGQPLKVVKTIMYVDDIAIGCIQNFKLEVDAYSITPNLTITFPDLKSDKIDPMYYRSANLISTLESHLENFKNIPGVNIVLEDVFKEGK